MPRDCILCIKGDLPPVEWSISPFFLNFRSLAERLENLLLSIITSPPQHSHSSSKTSCTKARHSSRSFAPSASRRPRQGFLLSAQENPRHYVKVSRFLSTLRTLFDLSFVSFYPLSSRFLFCCSVADDQ